MVAQPTAQRRRSGNMNAVSVDDPHRANMKKKRISIVTPCRNAEKYIRETIESIIGQTALLSGRAELEYIICDGASTDNTVPIIESYKHPSITLISEPDTGIYNALAKGLKMVTGDIVAYLNAGDFYNKFAFDIVLDIFETKKVEWLTGCIVIYNEKSHAVDFLLPYKYRKRLFARGLYGQWLPCVEQESTFWSISMHQFIDFDQLSTFRLAGDYYLWRQFSKETELKIVSAHLGGFKHHPGQLSQGMKAYYAEVQSMVERPMPWDFVLGGLDGLIWATGLCKVKKFFNRSGLYVYNYEKQEWV
jgi:glycosyltransferase involved in cell wall biosynthesis